MPDSLVLSGRSPRLYQQASHDATWGAWKDGHSSVMNVMPTGTGKTYVASMIATTAKKQSMRGLFLVQRDILARQAEATLQAEGLAVLMEMGSQKAYANRRLVGSPDVVVATVQSLHADRLAEWPRDYFQYIITDECHHAGWPMHKAVYEHFNPVLHVGITATPDGGSGLGSVYEKKCYELRIRDAVRDGWLVKPRSVKCPITVNLKGIRTTREGDFNLGELSARISPHVEELADGFKSQIGDRFAVAFLPDLGSSLAFAQALSGMGIEARYVAGSAGRFGMTKSDSRAILKSFELAEYQVICTSELLFEGWDCTHIGAVGVCRPTTLRYRYAQMVGRGLRPCPELGKEDLMIVDFDWDAPDVSRDLCAVIDLYADEEGDSPSEKEAWSRAKKKAAEHEERGEMVDVDSLLDEARDWSRHQDRLMIRLTGRKAKYLAPPTEYDPVGVGKLIGVKLRSRYDIRTDRVEAASPAQIGLLKHLGVKVGAGEISKWGASKLIDGIKKRQEAGLSSHAQVDAMVRAGVDRDLAMSLTGEQASKALEISHKQQELFH